MFKTKTFNAIVALEIILSMTLYYFVLIGFTAVTYAIDIVETNNHNVEFTAYFIAENGEKTNVSEKSINEQEYLYVDVTVKNEGYFNGAIKLSNSNFNIVPKILSDGIEEISGNEVKLKQINSGTTQTIKVLVEAIKDDKVSLDMLSGNTHVVLNGSYINSESIESEEKNQIKGTTAVKISWVSSKDVSSELNAKVITNSIYELNGEKKKIVQLQVDSKVKNNDYPIKNSTIRVNTIKNVEQIKVFARSTNATNDKISFSEKNYKYDETNGLLEINIQNDDTQNISWKKNSQDTFIVTLILNENAEVGNENITINSNIATYDNKILQNEINIVANEQIDGIVSTELLAKEDYIYKGKLYTGEERTYQTASKVYVNYSDLVNKITINEYASKYLKNEEAIDANILYKETIIKRENFIDILGNEGFIIIKNEDGTVISNINKTTQTDENGNIVVTHNIGTKHLVIETSKPVKEGTLNIVYTKSIINDSLTRDEINSINKIEENTDLNYNDKSVLSQNKKEIELRNTTSKAKFEIEPTKLTAMGKNTNVKMTAVLENNKEERDLYQNPVVRIKLPIQVKDISAKCKVMYKNGLELSNANIYKENDNYIIEIKLDGTQTVYNTDIVDGTMIIIYADIELQENTLSSTEEISMSYTNEYATSYEDNGEQKVNIQLEEIPEEIRNKIEEQKKNNILKTQEAEQQPITTTLKGYVGDQELAEGDVVYTGEIIRYEIGIENNTNEAIENVNIQARIPEGTKYVEYTKSANKGKYIEKEIENNIFRETIENIEPGDSNKIQREYEVKVEDDTEIANITNTLQLNYNDTNSEKTLQYKVEKAELKVELCGIGDLGDYISHGESYGFVIDVTNISDKDVENVKIKTITNSSYKLQEFINKDTFETITESNPLEIEKIEKGKTYSCYVSISAEKSEDKYASIYVTANDIYRSGAHKRLVEKSSIETELTSNSQNTKVKYGDNIIYNLRVKNTGDVVQKVFGMYQSISKYAEVKSVEVNGNELEYNRMNGYIIKDEKNVEGEENIENGETTEGEESEDDDYVIGFSYEEDLEENSEFNVVITAQIVKEPKENNEDIISYAKVNEYITKKVTHTLEKTTDKKNEDDYDKEDDDDNQADTDKQDDDSKQDSDKSDNKNTYSISGRIWIDENKDGKRDTNENSTNNAKVRLLNTDTNSIATVESKNGSYKFENLEKGKYIVIFDYDKSKYSLTKYQAENVSQDMNSDAENNKITLEGKEQQLAITDIITIEDKDITNIDLGLISAQKFDLELTKTVSKISINNANGTSDKEYDNVNMAKIEIHSKALKGSVVAIEYKIRVKNNGDIAGYAKQIVDYKPADLNFNSSLNKDWYQSGEYIYSKALEKEEIQPGETKELTLVLTKTMTESNTGLTNNIAEIADASSLNGTADVDSTFGNKKSGEDDLGEANVIVGIKTGLTTTNILTIVIILLATMTILEICFIRKSKKKIDN